MPRPLACRTGYLFAQSLRSGFMSAMGTPGPHTACKRPGRPLRQNKPHILSQKKSPRGVWRAAMAVTGATAAAVALMGLTH